MKKILHKICTECGKEFETTDGRQKRCMPVHPYICKVCGKTFYSDRKNATCSEACRVKAITAVNDKNVYIRECSGCGKQFTTSNHRERFCQKPHPYICENCGVEFTTAGPARKTCSEKCRREQQESKLSKLRETEAFWEKHSAGCKEAQGKRLASLTKNMQEKYGEEITNPMQVRENQEKVWATMLEKYGVKCSSQSPEIKAKMEATCLERYGVTNAGGTKESLKKAKQTNIERYGNAGGIQLLSNGNAVPTNEEFKNTIVNWPNLHNGQKPFIREISEYFGYNRDDGAAHRIKTLNLSEHISTNESYFESIIKNFLDELGVNYVQHDHKQLYPMELDFFMPEFSCAIEVNDFVSHNSSFCPWGEPKDKNYHYNKTKLCNDKGIRLIHIWENDLKDPRRFAIIKNIIKSACQKTKSVYARNCVVKVVPSIEVKTFFNDNNINGHRGAEFAYMLVDKNTNEPLMGYLLGRAHFGKGKYDCEIIRGATKLGFTVVGGASKIWKYIIKNTDYKSIVYYVDLNYFNGQSMKFLEGIETVSSGPSFKNYFVKDGIIKNRDPKHNHEIKVLESRGEIWEIWDAGVQVNIWRRKYE